MPNVSIPVHCDGMNIASACFVEEVTAGDDSGSKSMEDDHAASRDSCEHRVSRKMFGRDSERRRLGGEVRRRIAIRKGTTTGSRR